MYKTSNLIRSYYNSYTPEECAFIGYCNMNRIKIDWKNFQKSLVEWKKGVSLQSNQITT